ncbi:MAG: hypothetical protein QOG53_1102 [Frankiales bacterium]|jgi:hypothetical protein|nr:hypothetical protein [Frankiales bacterium]
MDGTESGHFLVGLIGIDESHDTNTFNLGIAESIDQPESFIAFMCPLDGQYDEQDVQLGMDTYCIVTGEQVGTYYGGVLAWRIETGLLHLALTEEASNELRLPRQSTFSLEVGKDDIALLNTALERVLGRQTIIG